MIYGEKMGKTNRLMKQRTIELLRGYEVGHEFNISMIISDYKKQWARHTPTTNSLSSVLRSAIASRYISRYRHTLSGPLTYTRIDEGEEE